MFEALPDDAIDALLAVSTPQPKYSPVDSSGKCPECQVVRDSNGYCNNDECAVDRDDDTYYDCPHCGWCKDPNKCVFGNECPLCSAKPSELCLRPNGGYEGLHKERWALVT